MDAAILEGGFRDATLDAQRVFRAVLSALAEPGTVHDLGEAARPPLPLTPALGALALALCDAETPVWLAPSYEGRPGDWITFQTGARVTPERAAAAFAFLDAPDFDAFPIGTETYPDRSATLILPAAFTGTTFTLRGPGIEASRDVALALPAEFAARWQANRALFPCGLDLILVDGARIMGLPRTTEVACTSR
ncbi:phosphonate C-P lyase system protein PhnH [Acuticoccus kandeliae]|uniref:phosphonate C-P lyase system protein PhnH n=1 Tax=Acuticoccus kandeliae TaxID=2073160 RepID=UPI000D3ECB71|nr:phosphonate C-P lyase system protein PhnH [Acuticoccus kandeliae]